MGCQDIYLLVPKGILRKLFSIEKKLIVLKFGNWARRNLAVISIFSAGLTKLDSTCLEEPLEKNFLNEKVFSICLDRDQKKFRLLDKISRKDVKISFYVSTRTVWGNFHLKFCLIFNFFSPLSKIFFEQSRWESSPRVVGNLCHQQTYMKTPFWRFRKFVDSKNKTQVRNHVLFLEVCCPTRKKFLFMGPSVGTCQCLTKTALACTKIKMMTHKKVQEVVSFRKKNNFNETKKTKFFKSRIFIAWNRD